MVRVGTVAEVQPKHVDACVEQLSNHGWFATGRPKSGYNFGVTVAVRDRIEFHVLGPLTYRFILLNSLGQGCDFRHTVATILPAPKDKHYWSLTMSVATQNSPATLRVNGTRLWDSLMELAKIGATPKGGVCRLALTDLDRQGRH